ncbi:sulfurtransferase TusA family protein [Bacteroides sp. 214]|uniref:sulfurtransferase TusA family protein n=1 Tax=Bacteroides sp. 214 TaxID=2302935 RepID=UPI0013D3E717|nr:sulfurtransferase TusA family protein [Bacteroides sp. 214]NDW11934.1 sulfurtransferase TusA family protein [Bacteroides sp. 214]
MKTIDTTLQNKYSQLIPAIEAICTAKPGEKLQIIMNEEAAFKDIKEYLSEKSIGFREIYDENKRTLQFKV